MIKVRFYNNWKDYLKGTPDYKGYFAIIPFAFYVIYPQIIIVLCNFSIILEKE